MMGDRRGPRRDPPRGGAGPGPRGPPRGHRFQPHGLPRVWRSQYGILTENAVPGMRVYGEKLFTSGDKELRAWNPRRSKLAALLLGGSQAVRLEGHEQVLYLGASTGTTVSHLADILHQGRVIAVEKSARSVRDLLDLARVRPNVLPVLSDAHDTDGLVALAAGPADIVYQDIAQRDQAEIFIRAARRFLRPGGTGILMIKARSISLAHAPERIYADVERAVVDAGFPVLDRRDLAPFEKDHAALVVMRPGN